MRLFHALAIPADQKRRGMVVAGMGMTAGDKGVQTFDPMRQTMFDQIVERAVDTDRCLSQPLFTQDLEQVISPFCVAALQQQFERAPPHRRQAQALRLGIFGNAPDRCCCAHQLSPKSTCNVITLHLGRNGIT